jgi:putative heme iron utilization protein
MTFPDDVVAAVCRHMNDDHADGSLLICRVLGGRPDAVGAVAVGVDAAGMTFEVDGAPVTVPFASPAPTRADVRVSVVELYERARSGATGAVP